MSCNDFFEHVVEETEGEGYVVTINAAKPYQVKLKNNRYCILHKTKDSVNNAAKLFEAVITECTDDMRSMFADDPYSLNLIMEMEKKVIPIYNAVIKRVEEFHSANKHLERKDYAILAKEVFLLGGNVVSDESIPRSRERLQRVCY
jgi:T4 RnlA family RNA ligase